jgi:hypothetical protein
MVETLGFRKVRGISSVVEEIFASQEDLVQLNLPIKEAQRNGLFPLLPGSF